MLYSKVVYSWKNAKVFIEESREVKYKEDPKKKLDTLYQELELLAKRWEKKPIKKKN